MSTYRMTIPKKTEEYLEDLRVRTGRRNLEEVLVDAIKVHGAVVSEYESGNEVLRATLKRKQPKKGANLSLAVSNPTPSDPSGSDNKK